MAQTRSSSVAQTRSFSVAQTRSSIGEVTAMVARTKNIIEKKSTQSALQRRDRERDRARGNDIQNEREANTETDRET